MILLLHGNLPRPDGVYERLSLHLSFSYLSTLSWVFSFISLGFEGEPELEGDGVAVRGGKGRQTMYTIIIITTIYIITTYTNATHRLRRRRRRRRAALCAAFSLFSLNSVNSLVTVEGAVVRFLHAFKHPSGQTVKFAENGTSPCICIIYIKRYYMHVYIMHAYCAELLPVCFYHKPVIINNDNNNNNMRLYTVNRYNI